MTNFIEYRLTLALVCPHKIMHVLHSSVKQQTDTTRTSKNVILVGSIWKIPLKYTSKITGNVQIYLFLLVHYISCITHYDLFFHRVNAHTCNINLPKCKLYKKRKSCHYYRVNLMDNIQNLFTVVFINVVVQPVFMGQITSNS